MTQQPHAQRDHATWSASASARRWACPGSLALEADAPPDKESHAAAWGTAAHEVAEDALRNHADCTQYIGTTVKTKEHGIEVDEEVAETAQVYVDYIRERIKGFGGSQLAICKIEQKFSLDKLNPPFEAGGTGDCVLMSQELSEIEIVDLKGGRGIVVEAKENKQLRTYALGAVLANPGPWKRVKATIVQPRAPHPDGRIRSEEFDIVELMDWTHDLLNAMHGAKVAAVHYDAAKNPHGVESVAEWAASFLEPGDHCTFCRAKPTCPALQSKALETAQVMFEPATGKPSAPPAPEDLEMEQIVRILDAADMIQNWLNAVRAYAQDKAESGVEVAAGESRYVLTPKQARRKWVDDASVEALVERTGRDADEFYGEPKMLTPAQVEKVLGGRKKAEEALAGLVESKSSGFNLVRADKTTRPAAVPPPQRYFTKEGA